MMNAVFFLKQVFQFERLDYKVKFWTTISILKKLFVSQIFKSKFYVIILKGKLHILVIR
jgi:hypothetical protein